MNCTIIGGGFAGVEAAGFLAKHGVSVKLIEMRPHTQTEVHQTGFLAEPVCSNSFKSLDLGTGHGLLKAEMDIMGSLVLDVARLVSVPAGRALAVDRKEFAKAVTVRINHNANIELVREEIKKIPSDGVSILAAGPLISKDLALDLQRLTGVDGLAFYDAIAPIVAAGSIDMDLAFLADRRSDRPGAYINCPMDQPEYLAFMQALMQADEVDAGKFEKRMFFDACLPVEVMGRRGLDTLRFGPMKPVGLTDPKTGRRPYAVVQLRQENIQATMFSLVGFQTKLRYPEQKRVFSMIPALHKARFLRYGSIHRNTFINAPLVLDSLGLRARPSVLVAGQLSGVEGYMESAASGIIAGVQAWRMLNGIEPEFPPAITMTGGLMQHLANANAQAFQPMNANFGLIMDPPQGLRGRSKKLAMANRAVQAMKEWKERIFP